MFQRSFIKILVFLSRKPVKVIYIYLGSGPLKSPIKLSKVFTIILETISSSNPSNSFTLLDMKKEEYN
jgi:hypothetical protein